MILKTISGKGSANMANVLQYVLRYVADPAKSELGIVNGEYSKPNIIVKNHIRARSFRGFCREFQQNESFRLVRRRDSVKYFHNVISLSNKDSHLVTEEVLKDLAEKFIELRAENCLVIGSPHFDKEHSHIHLVVSGVMLNGRSSRLSKQKFHTIKVALENYQRTKYPELENSLVEHTKNKKLTKKIFVDNIKKTRQTHKHTLLTKLEAIYKTSTSREHFLSQVNKKGHEIYYRNGQVQGVTYEGRKYRINRLGFDEERLQSLDKIFIENKTLEDLQALRSGAHKQALETINKANTHNSTKDEEKKLSELSSLRNKSSVLEIERAEDYGMERSMENDGQLSLPFIPRIRGIPGVGFGGTGV